MQEKVGMKQYETRELDSSLLPCQNLILADVSRSEKLMQKTPLTRTPNYARFFATMEGGDKQTKLELQADEI